MNNVIPLHTAKPAKAQGVALASYFAAERLGLSVIQCKAAARKARETYLNGRASAARVVADIRRESFELATLEYA